MVAFRINRKGAFEIFQRRLDLLEINPMGVAAIVKRLGIIGFERDGPVIAGDCLKGAVQLPERIAAIVPDFRRAGVQRQRPVETFHRLARPSREQQGAAAIVKQHGVVWRKRYGAIIVPERLVITPKRAEHAAAIAQRFQMIGIQRQHFGETGQRLIKALRALQLAAFGHNPGYIHGPLHTRWRREVKPAPGVRLWACGGRSRHKGWRRKARKAGIAPSH